jgi:hypothetical protein
VALSSSCSKDTQKSSLEPPNQSEQQTSKLPWQHASSFGSSWAVDDFLQFSDIEESTDKVIRSFCMDSIMSPRFCLQTILSSKGMKKLGESGYFFPRDHMTRSLEPLIDCVMVFGSS